MLAPNSSLVHLPFTVDSTNHPQRLEGSIVLLEYTASTTPSQRFTLPRSSFDPRYFHLSSHLAPSQAPEGPQR